MCNEICLKRSELLLFFDTEGGKGREVFMYVYMYTIDPLFFKIVKFLVRVFHKPKAVSKEK